MFVVVDNVLFFKWFRKNKLNIDYDDYKPHCYSFHNSLNEAITVSLIRNQIVIETDKNLIVKKVFDDNTIKKIAFMI